MTAHLPIRPAAEVRVYECAEYLRRRGFVVGEPVPPAFARILIQDIQSAVACRFNVRLHDMLSNLRWREYTRPRQVAMYLCRELTRKSLSEIGVRFDRDHTTVIHGVRQIEALRVMDAELDEHIRALLRELRG